MKIFKVTNEVTNTILPSNVKTSTRVSGNAKKVLTALLNYYIHIPKAVESGYVAVPNVVLCESTYLVMADMLKAVQELINFGLINRKVGKERKEGEKPMASQYTFNMENILKNPIKRQSPEQVLEKIFSLNSKVVFK